jgi:hypothetical protein
MRSNAPWPASEKTSLCAVTRGVEWPKSEAVALGREWPMSEAATLRGAACPASEEAALSEWPISE